MVGTGADPGENVSVSGIRPSNRCVPMVQASHPSHRAALEQTRLCFEKRLAKQRGYLGEHSENYPASSKVREPLRNVIPQAPIGTETNEHSPFIANIYKIAITATHRSLLVRRYTETCPLHVQIGLPAI